MKRYIAILTALLLLVCLVGCGSSKEEAASYDLASVMSSLEEVNPIANPRDIDDFAIENDFGFAEGDAEEYLGKISNDQGDPGMILLIKAAEGKGDDVKTALETYKADQVAFYGNYAEFAQGMALIQDGRIVQDGDYVFLVFSSLSVNGYDAIDSALSSLS